MKIAIFSLLLVFLCYAECKKTYVPIDKNANVAFINMEGGGVKPAPRPIVPTSPKSPSQPAPAPAHSVPNQSAQSTKPAPALVKPVQPSPAQPQPTPVKPAPPVTQPQPKTPTQIKPVPVNPAPAANPVATPGPGSVKDLVNFYNNQGKASPIRPYSYSQAVKQG